MTSGAAARGAGDRRPRVIVVVAREFAPRAAKEIAARIEAPVRSGRRCALALSGGRTPVPVFGILAGAAVPWPEVDLFLADERAVPPDDPESNFGMIRRELLDRLDGPGPRVHRIEGERLDTAAAAAEYQRQLPAAFDLLVLGIGPDGHTASIFPHSDAVGESVRTVVAVPPAPVEPRVPRITITPPVIAAAHGVLMLARGEEHAAIVARALDPVTDPREVPARLARSGTWLLDDGAAMMLQRGES